MQPDSTSIALVSTVASGVSNLLSSIRSMKEIAKDSKDRELKDALSDLQDQIIDLKHDVELLADENKSLRLQLEVKTQLKRDPQFGYYFAGDDQSPICPLCYEKEQKLIHLRPPTESGRRCPSCHFFYEEKPGADGPVISRGNHSRARLSYSRSSNFW